MDAIIVDKDGKWYSSKNTVLSNGHAIAISHGTGSHHLASHKRYRATVLATQDGKVLLVRDKGHRDFSMPGGGFKHGESTLQAGTRELGEEVGGLTIVSAERVRQCDLEGARAKHKVIRVEVQGHPHIRQHHEIDKVIWWDMKSSLPVQGHVKYILSKIKGAA